MGGCSQNESSSNCKVEMAMIGKGQKVMGLLVVDALAFLGKRELEHGNIGNFSGPSVCFSLLYRSLFVFVQVY